MAARKAKRGSDPADNSSATAPIGASAIQIDPLVDAFGFLVRRAWRDVERRFSYHFRTVALTPLQFSILILLEHNNTCTPGELVLPLGISQNNVVGIVAELMQRDYVTKQVHAEDRRARVLALTDAGHDVLKAAHEAHAAYTKEFVQRVGADNLRELVALLKLFDPN